MNKQCLSQTKSHSLLEALINIGTGMLIAFTLSQVAAIYEQEIQMYIWEDFKWDISAGSNFLMTFILTFVSICRSFFWRRVFNKWHVRIIRDHYAKNN